jgi:predicted DsbA family dithiol-disulfide isomerase
MIIQPMNLTVYFDILCPFAYRVSQWLDLARQQADEQLTIDWRYFSLEQMNAPEGTDWKLWEQTEDYENPNGRGPENRALLAFWSLEAARQQGSEPFNRLRAALYRARHTEKRDISQRSIIEPLAAQADLDMQRFQRDTHDRSLLDAIRRDYDTAREQHGVFGVPTFSFNDENVFFVKLMQVPPAEDALSLLHDLHQNCSHRPWLAELKRPRPGELR